MKPTTAGAVLAGGAGSRYAGPEHKLRALFRGRPLLTWALDAVDGAGFDQVYVVTGPALIDDLLGPQHTPIANPAWADGQATSVGVVLDAAADDGHEAVVIGLADQPLVPASAWQRVGAAAGVVVTATFDQVRRPPVKLHRSIWSEVERRGDTGARLLMQQRPDLVSELPCAGNPIDFDTLEDFQRWN